MPSPATGPARTTTPTLTAGDGSHAGSGATTGSADAPRYGETHSAVACGLSITEISRTPGG
jgi:hypothetical protein